MAFDDDGSHVNKVLDAIYGKLSQVSDEIKDTEGAEVIDGVKSIATLVTSPIKEVSNTISQLQQMAKERAEKLEEQRKADEEIEVETTEEIITAVNDIDLAPLEKLIKQTNDFLMNIIFGQTQSLDQLIKNQKLTNVFMIARKQKDEIEKQFAKQDENQKDLIEKIKERLIEIHNNSDTAIEEEVEKKEEQEEKKDDAPKIDPNSKSVKAMQLLMKTLGGVGKTIKGIATSIGSMLRFAAVAALKALIIIGLITAMVVGLDILQAVIRNNIGALIDQVTEFKDDVVETVENAWNALLEWLDKWVARPLSYMQEGFAGLQVILAKIQNVIVKGFAAILKAIPSILGGDSASEYADELIKESDKDLAEKQKSYSDIKTHNESYYQYDANGDRIVQPDQTSTIPDSTSSTEPNIEQTKVEQLANTIPIINAEGKLIAKEELGINKDVEMPINNIPEIEQDINSDQQISEKEYLDMNKEKQQNAQTSNNTNNINNVSNSSTQFIVPLSTNNNANMNRPQLVGY